VNILDLIFSRRTVHLYTPERVSKEIIEKAVRAGIHAPNHKLTWPWKFYLLGTKARAKMAELNPKFASGGEMMLVGIKKSADPAQEKEDYASLAAALQNMALYLWSEGYGTKWSTGKATRADEAYQVIGQTRDQFEICGIFWIGKAAIMPSKPERPDVSQFFITLD
jgi:nitroreductase